MVINIQITEMETNYMGVTTKNRSKALWLNLINCLILSAIVEDTIQGNVKIVIMGK